MRDLIVTDEHNAGRILSLDPSIHGIRDVISRVERTS